MAVFSEDRTRKLVFKAYSPSEKTSVWEHQLWPEDFAESASAEVDFLGHPEA